MEGRQDEKEQRGGADLTRREWILRLGETAVLLGFSCVASQEKGATESLPILTAPALPELPPGLYEPSNDHLSHALTQDDQLHPIPPGSETDYVRPRSGPFEPQFFSRTEFQTVRRIVELMLGEAAEPSEKGSAEQRGEATIAEEVAEWIDLTVFSAAGVQEAARRLASQHRLLAIHHYGAAAVEKTENHDAQRICREGLRWLGEESAGGDFLSLKQEQQIQLLQRINNRPQGTTENAGTRFFGLIKAEVIRGFYTSRVGLKEIDYKGNAFYAEPPDCAREHDAPPKTSSDPP